MKLFPLLHGPVELIGQGQLKQKLQQQLPKDAKSTRYSHRKSRRGTTIDQSSNMDYMKKSLMEEAQRKISEIASKKSDVLYGPVAKTSQISLSDRETRVNLQHSRHANELGRETMKEDDDSSLESTEKPDQDPTNFEPHQYRRHTSLNAYGQSADKSHHFRKDGKCFLYVTQLNLSAHSALSARQVLRTLQCVSATSAIASVSQISSVLKKAMEESSPGVGVYSSDEARTINALENNLSIEEHVGSFTATCDTNFLHARGAMESWIGQNVGNGYATFKGALLDLLSSKQLNFAAEEGRPADAAEQEDGLPDHLSSTQNEDHLLSSDGFNSKHADQVSTLNSDPGAAADSDVDLTRRILSTIENNINAFVSNNSDLFGDDDDDDDDRYPVEMEATSLQRSDLDFKIVPSVVRSALRNSESKSSKVSVKSTTAEHVSKLVHGGSMLSHRSSYHISANSKKLHSMELVLKGKMFTADSIWEQDHSQLGIVLRHYTNKLQFSEYQFSLTKAQISDLAKVAIESVLQSLFNDTVKVLQAVMGSISLERIDACFSDDIAQMLAPAASSFSTQAKSRSIADTVKTSARNNKFSTTEIGEMIQASNRNPEKTTSTKIVETAMRPTDAVDPTRQLDPLLEVVILRRKKEGLLAYCFPQIHTSEQ